MKKLEYDVRRAYWSEVEETCNRMALDCWELVTVVESDYQDKYKRHDIYLIFKRPKSS